MYRFVLALATCKFLGPVFAPIFQSGCSSLVLVFSYVKLSQILNADIKRSEKQKQFLIELMNTHI